MLFPSFFGNEQIKKTLSGLIDAGRIPHAILIDGPAGAGKKTLARIIAAAVVCDSKEERPCTKCRQCQNAFLDIHPDINFYEGDGASHTFKVDTVRKIRLDAFVKPNDAAMKVYILADAENMTEQAQNALLKILEEPPKTVVFILTCDSRAHVLETVLSRTQCISVAPVSEAEAKEALLSQCENLSEEDAGRAAKISGGNIGRAKMMLDEGFSFIADFFKEFVKAWCSSDIYAFLRLSGKLEKDSSLFESFLDILPILIRDASVLKVSSNSALSGLDREAAFLSGKTTAKKLYNAELAALDSQIAASQYANLTLHLTTLFARLWRCIH